MSYEQARRKNRYIFGHLRKNHYLCTRWWAIKRLVAHRRVFFDAVYSRMWNWVRSPIRNPVFPQSSRLPLYKEILRFLTKLRKIVGISKRNATLLLSEASFALVEIPSSRRRDSTLQGIGIIQTWWNPYLSREFRPSKQPCAYTQNTLWLYPKHLAPIPKIELTPRWWCKIGAGW